MSRTGWKERRTGEYEEEDKDHGREEEVTHVELLMPEFWWLFLARCGLFPLLSLTTRGGGECVTDQDEMCKEADRASVGG